MSIPDPTSSIPETVVNEDPVTVDLRVTEGYVDGEVQGNIALFVPRTREECYKNVRLLQVVFRMAQGIVRDLETGQDRDEMMISRDQLFPEVVRILDTYIKTRMRLAEGADLREIGV